MHTLRSGTQVEVHWHVGVNVGSHPEHLTDKYTLRPSETAVEVHWPKHNSGTLSSLALQSISTHEARAQIHSAAVAKVKAPVPKEIEAEAHKPRTLDATPSPSTLGRPLKAGPKLTIKEKVARAEAIHEAKNKDEDAQKEMQRLERRSRLPEAPKEEENQYTLLKSVQAESMLPMKVKLETPAAAGNIADTEVRHAQNLDSVASDKPGLPKKQGVHQARPAFKAQSGSLPLLKSAAAKVIEPIPAPEELELLSAAEAQKVYVMCTRAAKKFNQLDGDDSGALQVTLPFR